MDRQTLSELLTVAILVALGVTALLTAGQLIKLNALWEGSAWLELGGLGALILLEAALPLVPLVAAGLVFGRLRGEGGLLAWRALGVSPWRRYAMPALLGAGAALGAAWLATAPVPRAVDALRGRLVDAAMAGLAGEGRVALPGGGALQVSAGQVWAVLPAGEQVSVLHARDVAGAARADTIELQTGETWLWSKDLRVRVGQGTVALSGERLRRQLGMLGPPNALPSSQLSTDDPHHAFTWHRRLALPAMALLWGLLGALLGARFGGLRAVLLGTGAVAGAYWILRVGELSARAGFLAPAFAAWAPAALLGLALALWIARGRRIGLA